MRLQRLLIWPSLTIALFVAVSTTYGQLPAPNGPPVARRSQLPLPAGPAAGSYARPANYGPPTQLAPRHLPPQVRGMMPGQPPAPQPHPAQQASHEACPACHGGGCQHCRQGPGFGLSGFGGRGDESDGAYVLRFLEKLFPYGAGGYCAPKWFDLHLEAMYLTREDVSRGPVNFTSRGQAGGGPPNIVLTSDNLDFDEEIGFRFTAAMQLAPGTNAEFSYFGTFNWAVNAEVTGAADLFSTFSQFGDVPPGGFDDTDRSDLQSIEYSTKFDTWEVNYRKRWTAVNCRIQGSWLAGARFFMLDEDFLFRTSGVTGNLDYLVTTTNAATGGQVGGDFWATLIPGLRLGGEVKAGIFGVRTEQQTVIDGGQLVAPTIENLSEEDVAMLAEAGIMMVYRRNDNLTIRAGYQMVFIEGVALAPENFNRQDPFNFSTTRTPFLNHNGNVFLHGFTLGLEWMW